MLSSLKTCLTGANLIAGNIAAFVEGAENGDASDAIADLINAAADDCGVLAKQLRSAARDVRIAGRARAEQKGE